MKQIVASGCLGITPRHKSMATSSATALQRAQVRKSPSGLTAPRTRWLAWGLASSTLSTFGPSRGAKPAGRAPHKPRQVSHRTLSVQIKSLNLSDQRVSKCWIKRQLKMRTRCGHTALSSMRHQASVCHETRSWDKLIHWSVVCSLHQSYINILH